MRIFFGLQTLANWAYLWDEPGIFVAFEETSKQSIANAAGYGGNLIEPNTLCFLDAMPVPGTLVAGIEFDFPAMLEFLSVKTKEKSQNRHSKFNPSRGIQS